MRIKLDARFPNITDLGVQVNNVALLCIQKGTPRKGQYRVNTQLGVYWLYVKMYDEVEFRYRVQGRVFTDSFIFQG